MRLLQDSFQRAATSEHIHDASRRKFITRSVLGAGALMVGSAPLEVFAASDPRIVILGAGIAGLHAAYVLRENGFNSFIFEASNRAGGRMYSAKNLMGEGIVTELGAEFIDSTHTDMLDLAAKFNLPLLDTEKDIALDKYVYYFEGKQYNCREVTQALMPYAAAIKADMDALPDVIRYDSYGNADVLDKQSIIAYLQAKGMNGWLLSLFDVAFTTEYGLDASEQSSLNMLFLFDPSLPGCSLFGESDERYKIVGGNQRITDELAKRVGEINYGFEVKSIRNAGTGYRVFFKNGEKVWADYVICTIPFSILRNIDLELKEMTEVKMKCIQDLGYGRNAKTFAGYDSNTWREKGYLGEIFTDKNFQLGWEHSQLQQTKTFGYTFFTGGTQSDRVADWTLDAKLDQYTRQMDEVFAGSKLAFNGKKGQFYWPTFPLAKGSYACYKTGQWTSIAGAESESVGNVLFAGEHCSVNFQGFMNGGAETGRVAAESLLKVLK